MGQDKSGSSEMVQMMLVRLCLATGVKMIGIMVEKAGLFLETAMMFKGEQLGESISNLSALYASSIHEDSSLPSQHQKELVEPNYHVSEASGG
jgi:hypothetical protein